MVGCGVRLDLSPCRQVFNILAEEPIVPARWLVPRMRAVTGTGKELRYLTGPGAIGRFLTAPWRANRLLSEATGELVVGLDGGAQRRVCSASDKKDA